MLLSDFYAIQKFRILKKCLCLNSKCVLYHLRTYCVPMEISYLIFLIYPEYASNAVITCTYKWNKTNLLGLPSCSQSSGSQRWKLLSYNLFIVGEKKLSA